MLLRVLNFDGTGSISLNTDPLLVALPLVLQLQERSESSNKELRSHTYLLRAKEQAVPANLAFRVTASVSFSPTCVEIWTAGWQVGWYLVPSVLRKLSGERNSVLLRLTLSAIKLPARVLICDYGMSDPWHECTAKLTKAMGISWPRVKKNIEKHMSLESPSALSFSVIGPRQTFTSFPITPHSIVFSCPKFFGQRFRGPQPLSPWQLSDASDQQTRS